VRGWLPFLKTEAPPDVPFRASDFESRDLLAKILGNEEEHVDFLDRQFDLIKLIGIERYILLNSAPAPEQEG
jgi:bacterioferritin (cytochrome b1)